MCIPIAVKQKDGSIAWTNGWSSKRFPNLEAYEWWCQTGQETLPNWRALASELQEKLDEAEAKIALLEDDSEWDRINDPEFNESDLTHRWRKLIDDYKVPAAQPLHGDVGDLSSMGPYQ